MPALTDLCLATLPSVTPATLWSAWSLSPWTALPLALLLGVFLRSVAVGEPTPPLRRTAFAAGWLLMAAALISPLCRLSASLASAHMGQHVILAALAPPLLLFGTGTLRWLFMTRRLSAPANSSGASGFGGLAALTALYGTAIWLWHLPSLYDAILRSAAAHIVGYSLLVAVSLLFWRAAMRAAASGPAGAGAMAFAMLITTIHTGFLGALLTLSPNPWFASANGGPAFGLEPLEDQQIAGLIMWVPMAGAYLAATLAGLYRALGALADRAPQPAFPEPRRSA